MFLNIFLKMLLYFYGPWNWQIGSATPCSEDRISVNCTDKYGLSLAIACERLNLTTRVADILSYLRAFRCRIYKCIVSISKYVEALQNGTPNRCKKEN